VTEAQDITDARIIAPYLTGWERWTLIEDQAVTAFKRGDFIIRLIGKHDIHLSGKGFTGELRFYDAAKKVMELEK
jgi:hypothetical protein